MVGRTNDGAREEIASRSSAHRAPRLASLSVKILPLYLLYATGLSVALARRGFRARSTSTICEEAKRPVRILIVGATGGTGRELVTQALERGYAVTAFVRTVAKRRTSHPQLKVKQGDVLDYASGGSSHA
jgi:NADPH:quinone reductase-like Zn-dependent oxidoreductase